MNLAGVYKEITDAYCSGSEQIAAGNYLGEFVAITPDGFRLYIIPKNVFPFDLAKINPKIIEDVQKLLPKEDTAIDGEVTPAFRKIKNGTAHLISGGDVNVWVNSKFLQNFSKYAKYKVISPLGGVLVYEFDKLVAWVLPINPKSVNQ